MTTEDAVRVTREADRAAGVLVVDHVLRYNPVLRALQRLCAGRAAGRPAAVRLRERRLRRRPRPGPLVLGPGPQRRHPHRARRALLRRRPCPDGQRPVSRPGHGRPPHRGRAGGHRGGRQPSTPTAPSPPTPHSFTHAHRAERQLMRLDYGFAEARVTGWIPDPCRASARGPTTKEPPRWEQLPAARERPARTYPGCARTGTNGCTVAVTRDAGPADPAAGRGIRRSVPHLSRVLDRPGRRGPQEATSTPRACGRPSPIC